MPFKQSQISEEERFNWIKLYQCKKIGAHTFENLLNQYNTATAALEYIKSFKPNLIPKDSEIKNLVSQCTKNDVHIILACDKHYPCNMREIKYAPPLIFAKGNVDILMEKNHIAMVGARNASIPAVKFSTVLASELAEEGYCIISGMARGIDSASHRGALLSGKTIAVIAGGIDHIYPKENTDLYKEIIAKGCVISEHPVGFTPNVQHFAKRNRIIAAIPKALIVAEARENSGSLIAANFALDFGREVFAIPGSPIDPRNYGCNKLIQQGAYLVQDSSDIIEQLNYKQQSLELNDTSSDNEFYELSENDHVENIAEVILDNLTYSPLHIDELIAGIKISTHLVLQTLIELELDDKIIRNGDEVMLNYK